MQLQNVKIITTQIIQAYPLMKQVAQLNKLEITYGKILRKRSWLGDLDWTN